MDTFVDTFNRAIVARGARGFTTVRVTDAWCVTVSTDQTSGVGYAKGFAEACGLALIDLIASLEHHEGGQSADEPEAGGAGCACRLCSPRVPA